MKLLCILLLGVIPICPIHGKDTFGKKKDKATWFLFYDLNKNGQMDTYENPFVSVEGRVEHLLSQVTLEEKVGQMPTSLGWPMYERVGEETRLTVRLEKEISGYHIGAFWGFMRVDPWIQRMLHTGPNSSLVVRASNRLQAFVIEHSRLGIPLFLTEECPHGHMTIGTTVFLTSIGQASTQNPELTRQMGRVIATEASAQGAHIGYGPVLDLACDSRWSRVEGTYGEDPYLNGVMGVALVRGFRGDTLRGRKSVIATLKHFALYGWTEGGHNRGTTHLGERELGETIFPSSREAVGAGALSVMSSYNEIDGNPCTGSRYLLTDILKDHWQFKGFVVSDLHVTGGLREHGVTGSDYEAAVRAVNAGVDSDLGTDVYAEQLVAAARKGDVAMETVDKAVRRILSLKLHMGLFNVPFVDDKRPAQLVTPPERVGLAREVARQSIVLLKNEDKLLPLKKDIRTLAVIGPSADNGYNMLGDYTAPQADGSVVTVLEGIRQKVSRDTRVLYAKGCAVRDSPRTGFANAIEAVRSTGVVVMVVGGSSARDFSSEYKETGAAKASANRVSDMESGERYDRATLHLMGRQLGLLEGVRKLGKPMVLVLIKRRPSLMEGVIQEADAILDVQYPGMQEGNAVADVLFGDYNPAGRLTSSVPCSVGQLPVYYNTKRKGNRSRYTEEAGTPRYLFGYGLSYTTFSYIGTKVRVSEESNHCRVDISATVCNQGIVDGDEVVQLHLRDEVSSLTTPDRQLRALSRVRLKAGEAREITSILDKKSLALYMWDGEWAVESGRFTVTAGGSSEDIACQQESEINRKYTFKM